jgi:hypothetical protein
MKHILFVCMLVPAFALAQPGGSGSAPAPETPAPPSDAPVPAPDAPKSEARKACTDAMNADPTFAASIVEVADKAAAEKRLQLDLAQHETAAKAIAKNEKHVILAYAAMWIIAAAFVMFLWRRQQALKGEIAQLKADLDVAIKDGK